MKRLRISVVVSALLGALFVVPGVTPAGAAPTIETIASGLDSPRGLSFGRNGALYVAEGGRGGDGPCFPGPEGGNVCAGTTGAITRIWRGEQSRVLEGLPSIAAEGTGDEGLGPVDVALRNSRMFIVLGLGADPAERPEGSHFGTLIRAEIDQSAAPGYEVVADLAAFEGEQDPDGQGPDSNPHSVLALDGRRIVADAGGNSLLHVKPGGTISVLATFPNRQVPDPFGGPDAPPVDMQSVPTSVAQGPDGAYYVGQLTGFPFPVGEAQVLRVEPGEEPTVYATGFTNIIDLAFDEAGNLYVLEIDQDSILFGEDFAGRLIRVNTDGSQDVLVEEGLFAPGGVAIGPDGAAYVTTCTVCAGGGSVVRITT
jgi:hypothetical protein